MSASQNQTEQHREELVSLCAGAAGSQTAGTKECSGGDKETKGTESRPEVQVPYLNSRKGQ